MMISAAFLLLQTVGASAHPSTAVDTLVDLGGYRMHLVLYRGKSPLTLVMESGGGAALDEAWLALETRLSARTGATVVAYDRAGFGKSATGPPGLTPRQQVEHLDDVLQRLATPPGRLLVGTSYGGLLVMLHGHLYPVKVRGLVLVDPMNPRFVQATGEFVQSTAPHIEHATTSRDTALLRMVDTFDELVRDPDASDLGLQMPMVIVTAGEAWWGRRDIDRAWRTSHQAMAGGGPSRRLVIANGSNHDIAAKRPRAIVDAVLSLTKHH
jgi:pimeloyl-ACP methyl ester carboxylesterase